MFPELFRIPGLGLPIATYGVLLAIAFIAALWLTAHLAARDGLPKDRIYDLGLYILASSLIGSKVLMVITEWLLSRALGERPSDAPMAFAVAQDV